MLFLLLRIWQNPPVLNFEYLLQNSSDFLFKKILRQYLFPLAKKLAPSKIVSLNKTFKKLKISIYISNFWEIL